MDNDLFLLKQSLKQSGSAIAISDMDGYNLFVNDAWAEMHGYNSVELLGTHISIFHTENQFQKEVKPFIEEVMKVGYHEGEDTHIKKDGSILHTWMFVNVVKDKTGKPLAIVGACRDITERRQANEALKQARQQAEAANKAKNTFLANMSHELRTPLNAILGFSQLMVLDKNVTSKQSEYLNIIRNSGEHLLTLINDILEISKIESGHISLNEEKFNLYQMLRDIENMFRLNIENKNLQLFFEPHNDLPQYVRADKQKLSQILINLLSNAVRVTEKGNITVTISRYKKSVSNSLPSETYLSFEVKDTGTGIKAEYLDKIFEPFIQVNTNKTSQEGTGLGLAISRDFVQMMGGDMNVSSTVGHGSTFKFYVKSHIAVEITAKVEHIESQPIKLGSNDPTHRILIVDDVAVNRQLLVTIINKFGFDIREAKNGEEAVAIWEEWQPHLIWMDMRMPVMSGYEATRYIKANTKSNPTTIVAVTAAAFEEEREAILSVGCDDFLRKPFKETDITEIMKKHLGVRFKYEENAVFLN